MKQKLKRSKRWNIVIILHPGMTGYSFEWLVVLPSHCTTSVLHLWEITPELYREADKEIDGGWSLGVGWKASVCTHNILHPFLLSCAWERSFHTAADELTFPPQPSFGSSPAAGICHLNLSLYNSLFPAALINETRIEVRVDNRKEMWCQPSKRERS